MQDDHPFWLYSLAVYKPPCDQALLAAQDHFGLDINILLYCGWAAAEHRCLDEKALSYLEEEVGKIQRQVVKPLRRLRRSLPEQLVQQGVKNILLEAELALERLEQDAIYHWHNATSYHANQKSYSLQGMIDANLRN